MTNVMKTTLLFLLGVIIPALADEIKLADASASASVTRIQTPNGFDVSVSFRPVTTLDDVSNEEMTEVMARFYAEEALSSFLKAQKGIIPGEAKVTFGKAGEAKERWNFIVPESSVIDMTIETVEIRNEVVGKGAGPKTDASMRILDFRSSCFRDLRVAETLFAEKVDEAKDQVAKNALRQKIQAAFSALRQKIKADDNLFRSEKEELNNKTGKVENFLITRIDDGNSKLDHKEHVNEHLVKDTVFVNGPYRGLLMEDPILLTHGGARIVEMKDGSIVILSVGFANADNDDREEIAELKASAELGKLRAGEETVVLNKRERRYSRSTKNGETNESAETSRVSSISVNSMDFHKMGETVGTWLSKDGKRFFLAKGRIVSAASKEVHP